ncbi:Polypeptide-transport-associated domain protein ShlB-type [Burkholderia multivorans ATCC 17616]|nr:Polypeptide-transport-associated domain protein ShlB-type [Burkholderia multivorans ATCC 17616]
MRAASIRSELPRNEAYPALPTEAPCFPIDRFTLDVPASLPDPAKAEGASALPVDRFAFARELLDHYTGQCVGKQGIDVLIKGLSQAILARGYVTTRVLVPEQDLSTGTLKRRLRRTTGSRPSSAFRCKRIWLPVTVTSDVSCRPTQSGSRSAENKICLRQVVYGRA